MPFSVVRGLMKQLYIEHGSLAPSRAMNRHQLSSIMNSMAARRGGHVAAHWVDEVHDEDGGHDLHGSRPQDGRDILKQSLHTLGFTNGQATCRDDVSGAELNPVQVQAARKVEIDYFHKMNAYTRVKRSEALKNGDPIIL